MEETVGATGVKQLGLRRRTLDRAPLIVLSSPRIRGVLRPLPTLSCFYLAMRPGLALTLVKITTSLHPSPRPLTVEVSEILENPRFASSMLHHRPFSCNSVLSRGRNFICAEILRPVEIERNYWMIFVCTFLGTFWKLA